MCITTNTWNRFNGFNQTVTVQLEEVDDAGQKEGKLDQKEVGEEQREAERQAEGEKGRNRMMTGWSGGFSNVFSASPCHREIIPC